jgi:tetratricopeptide (TPR) repeat protein
MKTLTMSLIITLLLAGGLSAQQTSDLRTAGMDLLAAMKGDTERFERGMQTLDAALAKNPDDPNVKVLHGNGVFARSGLAAQKGDMQGAMKYWQLSMEEMAQAVAMAPDNIFVRARRGVVLISAARSTDIPRQMAAPLLQTAVQDFEKVLEVREKNRTLAQQSNHKRGELLTAIADGWNQLGQPEKARTYFERITNDMKGTVYEQKAEAWLENKPEAKAVDYFACTGCHVE